MGIIRKELLRKAFHLTGLIVPFLYYFFVPRDAALPYLAIVVLGAGLLEAVRLSGRDIYPDTLLRDPSEKKRLYGYFWAVLSMLLAVFLFDKAIAVASLLFMLLGDSASGIAGAVVVRGKGAPLSNPKPPFVIAAMFLTCALSGLMLYPVLSLPVIFVGAIGATFTEALTWRIWDHNINDNLSIPLASGTIMTLTAILLSYWR
jgi:dolichol kinase